MSGGLSLSAYVMDVCGPKLCGLMKGIAPGAVARLDFFGPYLAGALGVTMEASATWVNGSANAVWGGFYGAFTAGPILRWLSKKR